MPGAKKKGSGRRLPFKVEVFAATVATTSNKSFGLVV